MSRYAPLEVYPCTDPGVRLWLVNVPLAGHAPSMSQRIAFLHWASHVADYLIDPCVSVSIPRRINAPVLIRPCVQNKFLRQVSPQAPPFPQETLLSICGTMDLSDSCYPSSFLTRLYAVLLCNFSHDGSAEITGSLQLTVHSQCEA